MKLVVEPWGDGPAEPDKAVEEKPKRGGKLEDATRVLYLNNHPLINTRLLV